MYNVHSRDMDQLRIVICGSMSHYKVMAHYRDQLSEYGIPTLVPESDESQSDKLSREKSLEIKSNSSRIWLNEVKSSMTYGILVVNEPKRGMENYIGANTFAEIAIAFDAHKQIFLLHDFYTPYEDELLAWNVVPLFGQLEDLVSAYCQAKTKAEHVRKL